MAAYLIPVIAGVLCLALLSVLATRQWRRQRDALAQLQNEVERRELAEEALRQSVKMEAIGRLTGGIAHDFNNHLTVISSNIELLQRRLPPDSEALERLATAAMSGVQRAATLTHRLLALSRQQPLDPEPLDIGRLVNGMLDLLRRTLGESFSIETSLAGGLWQARVDANQMENVLLNLAINARNATPGGGKLRIETANVALDEAYAATQPDMTAGQYVLLSMSDTNTVTTPDAVETVFEPVFATKPTGQNSDIGLSMVYGFIRQSGGHVAIDSGPGRGSTIKIYLPRFVPAEATVTPRDIKTVSEPKAAGQTILVVEDDEAVRRSSVEALRDMGYEVLEAGDAMDGVRLIVDRGGIDLLFTDIGLPGGVNGRALADAARSAKPGLRILFTTGYAQSAVIDDAVTNEGVHFIAKPFTLVALSEKVRGLLGAPAMATEPQDNAG